MRKLTLKTTLGRAIATGFIAAGILAPIQGVFAEGDTQPVQFATGPVEFSIESERYITGRIVATTTYDVWVRADDGTLYDVRFPENATISPSASALTHGQNVVARGQLQGKIFLASFMGVS
jgi:hypothetical protein